MAPAFANLIKHLSDADEVSYSEKKPSGGGYSIKMKRAHADRAKGEAAQAEAIGNLIGQMGQGGDPFGGKLFIPPTGTPGADRIIARMNGMGPGGTEATLPVETVDEYRSGPGWDEGQVMGGGFDAPDQDIGPLPDQDTIFAGEFQRADALQAAQRAARQAHLHSAESVLPEVRAAYRSAPAQLTPHGARPAAAERLAVGEPMPADPIDEEIAAAVAAEHLGGGAQAPDAPVYAIVNPDLDQDILAEIDSQLGGGHLSPDMDTSDLPLPELPSEEELLGQITIDDEGGDLGSSPAPGGASSSPRAVAQAVESSPATSAYPEQIKHEIVRTAANPTQRIADVTNAWMGLVTQIRAINQPTLDARQRERDTALSQAQQQIAAQYRQQGQVMNAMLRGMSGWRSLFTPEEDRMRLLGIMADSTASFNNQMLELTRLRLGSQDDAQLLDLPGFGDLAQLFPEEPSWADLANLDINRRQLELSESNSQFDREMAQEDAARQERNDRWSREMDRTAVDEARQAREREVQRQQDEDALRDRLIGQAEDRGLAPEPSGINFYNPNATTGSRSGGRDTEATINNLFPIDELDSEEVKTAQFERRARFIILREQGYSIEEAYKMAQGDDEEMAADVAEYLGLGQ